MYILQVPALAVLASDDGSVQERVHDSLECVRYVDEKWGSGRLQSTGNEDVQRGITVAEEQIIPHFYKLLMEAEMDRRPAHSAAICSGLRAWVAARPAQAAPTGPFFLGASCNVI